MPQQTSEHETYVTKIRKLRAWGYFLCAKKRAVATWLMVGILQQGHQKLALRGICLYFAVTCGVDEPIISESCYTFLLLSETNVNLNWFLFVC